MLVALDNQNEHPLAGHPLAGWLNNIKEIEPGVYEINHHNGEFILWGRNGPSDSCYFTLPEGVYSYGVCDSWENLKQAAPSIISGDETYIVFLTAVIKSEQSSSGGWRWHKWGEYIGKHKPTTEYLYDEPLIDKIYCYHVYKVAVEGGSNDPA